MKIGRRIVRNIVETGPASRAVIQGLARDDQLGDEILGALLEAGALVMIGDKKGAVYGTPQQKAARPRRGRSTAKRQTH